MEFWTPYVLVALVLKVSCSESLLLKTQFYIAVYMLTGIWWCLLANDTITLLHNTLTNCFYITLWHYAVTWRFYMTLLHNTVTWRFYESLLHYTLISIYRPAYLKKLICNFKQIVDTLMYAYNGIRAVNAGMTLVTRATLILGNMPIQSHVKTTLKIYRNLCR